MDKDALAAAVSDARAAWEATIAELGPEGLERPRATGEWRVRDVLAHLNGWDRWQLVQLRCAFTGDAPTEEELTGGVAFPANDDPSEDAMNAMFVAGNRDRPSDHVVADWREIAAMRASWVSNASQDQLDAEIGWDHGAYPRVCRLASEVPSVPLREHAWERVLGQVAHQQGHMEIVRRWMGR